MIEVISDFLRIIFLIPLYFPSLAIIYIFSYFVGSIPFAFLLTKIFGFGDIRKIGSGNIGATNVLRTGNKLLAFSVLIFDILKGFLLIFILKNYFFALIIDFDQITNFSILNIFGLFIILGHIFPIWLKFKGGKGVATYIGFLFAINLILGFCFVFFWLCTALITKYSSLSSIVSCFVIPFILLLGFTDLFNFVAVFSISTIIILKHYSNILRLLNKTENQIRF